MRILATLALTLIALAACTDGAGDGVRPTRRGAAILGAAPGWSRVLVPGQVTLRPAGLDRQARGPTAVAVTPDGAVLLLDHLDQRVLRITAQELRVLAAAPPGADDLAAADEAFVVHDRLRARVRIHDSVGGLLGELPVPRVLRAVRGVTLGPSREVWLQDVHQQRYRLGSLSAPQPLEAVLQSVRAGEHALASGEGVQARVIHGVWELRLVRRRAARDQVVRTHRFSGPILAARIVGTAGRLACVRLERGHQRRDRSFHVRREVVCVDVDSGDVVFSRPLPAGAYLPRRELALCGARLAHIRPEGEGLRVTVWTVDTEGKTGR